MSEKPCGVIHSNVEDAIEHAYLGLVQRNKHLLSQPYWGTRGGNIGNIGKVIGWMTFDGRKRWRLDYDPLKGVHLNEEDFTFAHPKKVFHPISIGLGILLCAAGRQINLMAARYLPR